MDELGQYMGKLVEKGGFLYLYRCKSEPSEPIHSSGPNFMVDDDDKNLLAEALAGVRPIKHDKVFPERVEPKPSLAQLARRAAAMGNSGVQDRNYLTDAEVEWLAPDDWLEYRNPGVQHGVFKKLRLGHYQPARTLDLHRMTVKEARAEVWKFLLNAVRHESRCIQITHGKGGRETSRSVLKSYVNFWLRQVPEVIAFHSCQPRHGGLGAVYVLLKKADSLSQQNRENYP